MADGEKRAMHGTFVEFVRHAVTTAKNFDVSYRCKHISG